MKITSQQLEELVKLILVRDYIDGLDSAELYGFRCGINYTLNMLGYDRLDNDVLYRFQNFVDEQHFIENVNLTENDVPTATNKEAIERYAKEFFSQEPKDE